MPNEKLKIIAKEMQSFESDLVRLLDKIKDDASHRLGLKLDSKDLYVLSLTQIKEMLGYEELEEGFYAKPENKILNNLREAMYEQSHLNLNDEDCLMLAITDIGELLGLDKILLEDDEL